MQSWSFLSKFHLGCSVAVSCCSQVPVNFPSSPQGYMAMFAYTQIQAHMHLWLPKVLPLSWIRLNHLKSTEAFLGWKRPQRVQPQQCQARPEHLLNPSRDGDLTTALGSLVPFFCLTCLYFRVLSCLDMASSGCRLSPLCAATGGTLSNANEFTLQHLLSLQLLATSLAHNSIYSLTATPPVCSVGWVPLFAEVMVAIQPSLGSNSLCLAYKLIP